MSSSLTRRQCLAVCAAASLRAADSPLALQWRSIAAAIDGTVGATALHLPSGRRDSINGAMPFPMASVCKLPLAAHMLALMEDRNIQSDAKFEIPKYDVWPGVSIIAERWEAEHWDCNRYFSLDQMLEWMVARSDNTAVQSLFRYGGGKSAMIARLAKWKIDGMRLDRSERQCAFDATGVRNLPPVEKWEPGMDEKLIAAVPPADRLAALKRFIDDPRDTATPDGAVQLIQKLYAGDLLNVRHTDRLVEILQATTTGPARIKGLLPSGTVVGHKTGTGWSDGGLNSATNDAGMIELPGKAGQIAIAVFIKGSTAPPAARENVIAQIARSAYDSWSA